MTLRTAEETGPGKEIGPVSVHGTAERETDTGVAPERGGSKEAAPEKRENEEAARKKNGNGGAERKIGGPGQGTDGDQGNHCPCLS